MNPLVKYALVAWISLAALFAPIGPTLATMFALVFADLVLGLAVSIKRKKKITSSGLKRSVWKLVAWTFVLGALFLAEKFIGLPIPVVKPTAMLIAGAEVLSLLESANALTGGKVFKVLIDKLNVSGGSKGEGEEK